jgi:aspartate racemase
MTLRFIKGYAASAKEFFMNGVRKEMVVGILGGMGPEATVDLMQRLIRLTPAADDLDHIRCIIDNNPKIPSRIKAIIEGSGESPVPCLVQMARGLEACGVAFLAIPCMQHGPLLLS